MSSIRRESNLYWTGVGMKYPEAIDYETYQEIMGELDSPIMVSGLDLEMVKRLYESKAVYLENLRVKCFCEINSESSSCFTNDDYLLILNAIKETKLHLRNLILLAVTNQLDELKAS